MRVVHRICCTPTRNGFRHGARRLPRARRAPRPGCFELPEYTRFVAHGPPYPLDELERDRRARSTARRGCSAGLEISAWKGCGSTQRFPYVSCFASIIKITSRCALAPSRTCRAPPAHLPGSSGRVFALKREPSVPAGWHWPLLAVRLPTLLS